MFDILALTCAIILLIGLLQLRMLLAREFPTVRARIVPVTPPSGVADLYADARGQLTALGFEEPCWLLLENNSTNERYSQLCAVYRHRGESSLVWLHAPASAAMPNRLMAYWTTTLADGRVITSQAFDPYFELMASDETPAQTIDGLRYADQWEQHQLYRSSFPVQGDPRSLRNEAIISQAGEGMNRRRERLLERGLVWRDKTGAVRARLTFALRMLRMLWGLRKPKEPAGPVSAARLAILAGTVDRVRHAEPSKHTQWGLFAGTVALSASLGAVIWDVRLAVMLLAVVLFHELGHYLAMRVFGYRNVHMMALPLVGGVTIGVDAKPAANRRAWMSLMGPLPGIVLGWALMVWVMMAGVEGDLNDGLYDLAFFMLLVNYLNVLPIPPLDGSHVVQALLPARWVNVQAVFIAVTSVIGAVIAVLMDFYALAVLAVLQLYLVRTYLQNGVAVRRLLADGIPPERHGRSLRLRWVLDVLESLFGPAKKAMHRINQAEQILQVLDTRPMSWRQRFAVGTVFGVLLMLPAVVVAISAAIALETMQREAKHATYSESRNDERKVWTEQVRAMNFRDFLRDNLASWNESELPAGASRQSIEEAEKRLNVRLPDDVRMLYEMADGVPGLGIGPLTGVAFADHVFDEKIGLSGEEDVLGIEVTDGEQDAQWRTVKVPVDRVRRWLLLNGRDEEGHFLLLDLDEQAAIDGGRFIVYDVESPVAWPSLRNWLEYLWVQDRWYEDRAAKHKAGTQVAYDALDGVPIDKLLDEFERPSWMDRLLYQREDWPSGAEESAIDAAGRRLDVEFPADLRELFGRHDGFPPRHIFPLDELVYANEDIIGARFDDAENDEQNIIAGMAREALYDCVLLGGIRRFGKDEAQHEVEYFPTLLWCPGRTPQDSKYVDLLKDQTYGSFHDYLRRSAAAARWQRQAYIGY